MANKPVVKMALTPEQQAQIRQTTGMTVASLQLKLTEVEQRLSPGIVAN